MADRTPRLSIGLPVYNGEHHVSDAIESIRSQTFEDFELVVSDNASTDSTPDIVRAAAAEDPRIRFVPVEENVGANRNFNRTFFLATGELFKWAAHDDVLKPSYLEHCVAILDDDPAAVLAHTLTEYIGSEGEELLALANGWVGADGFIERLPLDNSNTDALAADDVAVRFDAVVNKMSVFFDIFGVGRRSAFRRTLLLPHYYGADKVFMAEMALQGKIVRHDDVLFRRRCHGRSSTRTTDARERAAWSDPGRRFNYGPMRMVAGFAEAVANSDLSPDDKRRCQRALATKLRSPVKLLRGL